MLDQEVLRLLSASLDADFAERDKGLAQEVERTKNEMSLNGHGRSAALIEAVAGVFDRELLARAFLTREAFSRAMTSAGVEYSDQVAGQLRTAITDRISSVARTFDERIAGFGHLVGLPTKRTVGGAEQAALQGLAMDLALRARENRVEPRRALLANRTEQREEHYDFAENLRTPADIERLIKLLFDHPEQALYVYQLESQPSAQLTEAVDRGDTLIERTELYFFRQGAGSLQRVDPNTNSPSEKAVMASSPKYVRHKLVLSAKKHRELENLEAIRTQREANLNPLELKPNLFGLGIDLAKVPAWARRLWLRRRAKAKPKA